MFKPVLTEIPPYRVATPPHRIKLNQNESPTDLPADLRRAVLRRVREAEWNRYPPFPADELRRRLARQARLSADRVLIGHGSNELVLSAALGTLRRGSRVVIPVPSFPVFGRVAKICEARVVEVPLTADLQYPLERLQREASRPSTRLVFLASPNNPTGTVLAPSDVEAIARTTSALVVLDEAYHEFGARSHRVLLERLPNVVVTRTFSKAYAMASVRLGWAMGSRETIARLEAATLPFSIDLFAQIAALEILDRPELIRARVSEIRRERERVRRRLSTLSGLRVYPSEANFLLVRFQDGAAAWRALLARGILVRDVSSQPGLDDCLRITIGKPRENNALVRALAEIAA